MRISTKGHYAVQALVDIAARPEKKPVSLAVVADGQGLSQNYLEQLFVKLRKAGLVKSVRGPGGGYLIARSPSSITIGEVFAAVDESLILTDCGDEGPTGCGGGENDQTRKLWQKLCHHFNELLYSITIDHVVKGDVKLPRIGGPLPGAAVIRIA
ncbi:MAG: Rrf2 family transcriptional regulator [Nitrospinae bacterium]|nr:Rrf2 family transcriptional regulator [Nitrospinota bacterium]